MSEQSSEPIEVPEPWRQILKTWRARWRTPSYAVGAEFVAAVAAAAEAADHHPLITWAYSEVEIAVWSHDVNAITQRDARLARTIAALAERHQLTATPTRLGIMELALDSANYEDVKPFWRAVLGGEDNPQLPDEVRDPMGFVPTLWFQQTDAHDVPRQRFHLDIHVAHDEALQRIAAALVAGGTLIDDTHAPGYVVLSDQQGNRACVCVDQRITSQLA